MGDMDIAVLHLVGHISDTLGETFTILDQERITKLRHRAGHGPDISIDTTWIHFTPEVRIVSRENSRSLHRATLQTIVQGTIQEMALYTPRGHGSETKPHQHHRQILTAFILGEDSCYRYFHLITWRIHPIHCGNVSNNATSCF